ncbi:MAG: cytochrome c3 family protein, partial [Acidobacteria bacterium]|nr:cytochrome c3 family protein [Acidobacteriota bacterium]
QGTPPDAGELKKLEIRRMDCMDCHNRPSHICRDPDAAVDNALLTQLIDRSLPYIKREAVRLLSEPYPTTEKALEHIATSLDGFYFTRYRSIYDRRRDAVKKAIAQVQQIYQTNFFPEMRVDWQTHQDNIGHTLYPVCFRCHDGRHVSREGKVVRQDCQLCHAIIGQEAEVGNPTEVAMAEKFKHPWLLRGRHAELGCNECHWRGRGLAAECVACHPRPADAPMAFDCSQCHQKEQSAKPVLPCADCHTALSGLHLSATHSASECAACHVPHEWKVSSKQTCLACHEDKGEHNAGDACHDCHKFRLAG